MFRILFLTITVLSINIIPAFGQNEPFFTLDNDFQFGPFITYQSGKTYNAFGFRPIFYVKDDKVRDMQEFEFLYPLASQRNIDGKTMTQFLLYLFSSDVERTPEGYFSNQFTFFPFVHYKDSTIEDERYFALFPVYGTVKKKYRKDEITFILFPIYMELRTNNDISTYFLWPFFGVHSGEHEGFRIWPFYGRKKKAQNNSQDKFIMWPFFVDRRKDFWEGEVKTKGVWPFYLDTTYLNHRSQTYLWPFFNRTVNTRKGIERIDAPWPFVNITKGERPQKRFFPFYSKRVIEEDTNGFIMWPLYRYKNITLEDHIRRKKTVLLLILNHTTFEPIKEGGKEGKRIDLWPIFTYKTLEGEKTHFHFLTLFEPFLKKNDRLYRSWAPFWRIVEYERYEEGVYKFSLLWKLVVKERTSKVNYSFKLLGGLLGIKKTDNYKKYYIFYIPIKKNNNKVVKNVNSNVIEGNIID